MKPRLRLLLAMELTGRPMSNDELRQAIGRPDMPQCTVTWNLNELADHGAVESSKQSRYNRWSLTDYGHELALASLRGVEQTVERKLAARRAPVPTKTMVERAIARMPRTVFELALMSAPQGQRSPAVEMQARLFEDLRS